MMYTFRATIRLGKGHDFIAEVRATDQIQARQMLETLYGRGTIIGNCVTQVTW